MIDAVGLAIINGLTVALILFLVAVGLNVIFGVLDIINFAHGSFYMLGAYFTYFLLEVYNTSFVTGIVVGSLLVGLLGLILERTVIRRIYNQNHIFQLLLTYALVLILDNGARILWGVNFRAASIPAFLNFQVADRYPAYSIFLIVTGGILAVIVWYLFEKTRTGKLVQAASEDREVASSLGVNVPFLYTGVFFSGAFLAGLGGALIAPYRAIHPQMGETIIIEAFIVVIIGGMGSFRGAFAGVLLIGLVDSFAYTLVPQVRPALPFLLLIGVIMLKPDGIFGGN